MFRVFLLLVLCCYPSVQQTSANSLTHRGCYKSRRTPTTCRRASKEAQEILSDRITTSVARAVQWVRDEQKSKLWVDVSTSSWVMTNMMLAGYVNDDGMCTKTMQDTMFKIRLSLKNVADISAGKLAMLMLGMRATCQDVKNFNHQNLIGTMTRKMKSFPADDFNHFYPYSLAVLAMYVNDVDVPERYGRKLIQYLSAGKSGGVKDDSSHMTDTQAVSIIALSAIMKQRGISGQFLTQANEMINGAIGRVNRQMEKGEIKNVITLTHILQVLQLQKPAFNDQPYCENITTSILANQNASGSFGDLMTSVGLLPLLSGVSLLELREMKCPLENDNVGESEVRKFIATRRRRVKQSRGNRVILSEERIEVSINIESAVEGVTLNAHAQTVTLKKGSTALNALTRASKRDECFRHRVKETAWGPFVDVICNIKQNNRKTTYWMFYVNGKMAAVGAGKYVLKNNDVVVFRYKKVD